MDVERNNNAKKYFIFKLPDYINNTFHFIEKKRMESLSLYLLTCINLYKEITSDINNDKLLKAYESLLKGLLFVLKNHPFCHLDEFNKDFSSIHSSIVSIIKEKNFTDKSLNISIDTLYKKVKRYDYANGYLKVIKKVEDFKEVDIIICSFLSDLLYSGYSLKYISEWINTNFMGCAGFYSDINNNVIDKYIDKLIDFNRQSIDFEIIKKVNMQNQAQLNYLKEYLSNHYEVTIGSADNTNEWLKDENAIYIKVKVSAFDQYQAINKANNLVEVLINTYKLRPGNNSKVTYDNQCGVIRAQEIHPVDIRSDSNIRLLNYIDKRQKEMVQNFWELRFNPAVRHDDLQIIERILHTLQNSKYLDSQNRFLNYWASLEYLLYTFHKNSIIEKTRVVVPKSFCLYFIKDKMNIFWERFSNFKIKRKGIAEAALLEQFFQECKKDDSETEYDTNKLAQYISDTDKAERIRQALHSHVVLQRELMELNFLLNNKKGLQKELEFHKQIIENDLNLIYRFRNQLIHSANSIEEYLDFVSLRLYTYVNSIISTILYYKKQSALTTIEEVLNSIDITYEWHIKVIDKDASISIYELVRPSYHFIEMI